MLASGGGRVMLESYVERGSRECGCMVEGELLTLSTVDCSL